MDDTETVRGGLQAHRFRVPLHYSWVYSQIERASRYLLVGARKTTAQPSGYAQKSGIATWEARPRNGLETLQVTQ